MSVLQNAIANLKEEVHVFRNQGKRKTEVYNSVSALNQYAGWGSNLEVVCNMLYDVAGGATAADLAEDYPLFNDLHPQIQGWIAGSGVRLVFSNSALRILIELFDIHDLGLDTSKGVVLEANRDDDVMGNSFVFCDMNGDGGKDLVIGHSVNYPSSETSNELYISIILNGTDSLTATSELNVVSFSDSVADATVSLGSSTLTRYADVFPSLACGNYDGDDYEDVVFAENLREIESDEFGTSVRGMLVFGQETLQGEYVYNEEGIFTASFNAQIGVPALIDFDHDGYDDIWSGDLMYFGTPHLIFAEGFDTTSIISDFTHIMTIKYNSSPAATVYAVSNVGDVNDDGVDDALLGYKDDHHFNALVMGVDGLRDPSAPTEYLFSLSNSADEVQIFGDGYTYPTVSKNSGDFNNDGVPDLVFTNSDRTVIYFGDYTSNSAILSQINQEGGPEGVVISDIGGQLVQPFFYDVNRDGIDDLILSNHAYSSSRGEACIIFGGESVASTLTRLEIIADVDIGIYFTGENLNEEFGLGVDIYVGDLDGDGYPEIYIGGNQVSNEGLHGTINMVELYQ